MFDNLLNRYSPLAAVYNTLVIVKSAFQQFDAHKPSCSSEATHQIEPIQVAFVYNPYAGIDQENLYTSDSQEDGFTLVGQCMEVGVDTDHCLVEADSSGGKSTATAHDGAATATSANSSAGTCTAFYVSLIDSAYNLASVLATHVACNRVCDALLSCNLSWNEEPTNVAADGLMKLGLTAATSASKLPSDSTQPKKVSICAKINSSLGVNTAVSASDLPSLHTQPERKGITAEIGVNFDAKASTPTAPMAPKTAHPETRRVGIDANTKIGINTITSSSAAIATGIAQPENKGFGAQMDKNLNAEPPSSASVTNSDSPKTTARGYDANVGVKFAINSTAFAPDLKYDAAQPGIQGLGIDIGVNMDINNTGSAASSYSDQIKTKRLGIDFDMALVVNTATSASNLKSELAQKEMKGFGTDVGMALDLNPSMFTTDLPSDSAQSRTKRFGADFGINFGLNTTASIPGQPKKRRFGADFCVQFGFSTTTSTPTQLKTRRIGADFGLKLGFTVLKKYITSSANATSHSTDTNCSDDTWEMVEQDCNHDPISI